VEKARPRQAKTLLTPGTPSKERKAHHEASALLGWLTGKERPDVPRVAAELLALDEGTKAHGTDLLFDGQDRRHRGKGTDLPGEA
jgi:hypothetical protein